MGDPSYVDVNFFLIIAQSSKLSQAIAMKVRYRAECDLTKQCAMFYRESS